jgi:hypothetical protein
MWLMCFLSAWRPRPRPANNSPTRRSSRLLGHGPPGAMSRPKSDNGRCGCSGPGAGGAGPRSTRRPAAAVDFSAMVARETCRGREVTEGIRGPRRVAPQLASKRGKSRVSLGRDQNPLGMFPLPGGPLRGRAGGFRPRSVPVSPFPLRAPKRFWRFNVPASLARRPYGHRVSVCASPLQVWPSPTLILRRSGEQDVVSRRPSEPCELFRPARSGPGWPLLR